MDNICFSAANDRLLLAFICSYMIIAKGFTEKQLSNFRTYDLINGGKVRIEGDFFYVYKKKYFPEFSLTSFEWHIMKVYYLEVRSKWVHNQNKHAIMELSKDYSTTVFLGVCGIPVTEIAQMFHSLKRSGGMDRDVDLYDAQPAYLLRFSYIVPAFRPTPVLTQIMYNVQKETVNTLNNFPIYSKFERVYNRQLLSEIDGSTMELSRSRRSDVLTSTGIFFVSEAREQIFERCQIPTCANAHPATLLSFPFKFMIGSFGHKVWADSRVQFCH